MQLNPIRRYASAAAASNDQITRLLDDAGIGKSDAGHHIALVGTFAPRKCGIATFTSDVFEQLRQFHPNIAVDVYALDHSDSNLVYDEPKQIIRADNAHSYSSAARRINQSNVDAVWIQHEFGIFGENDGEAICRFVEQIAAPLIFTFHTVLTSPSPRQSQIMGYLISRASRIMVMSEQGRELLTTKYGAPRAAVHIIHHGAPDRPFGRSELFKARLGLTSCDVLMTFGLLGPGKGLERVIEALPAIVARYPDAIYRIVGATHPNLVAQEGEAYREGLQALAERLGVERHVAWENRFLETPQLLDQLEACDIYVTPYPNLQQSTSGTLSYAVALGKAVVSTPYVHARELLAEGVGVLVEPDSSEAVASAILDLLDDRAKLAGLQHKAYARGRSTIWPEFARASANLIASVVIAHDRTAPSMVSPNLSAVFEMSDDTGMFQHAIGTVADRNHGYCLDDNARASMLMNVADDLAETERNRRSRVYASFLQHAWNAQTQGFRNFMRFDRSWCEETGSDDSNGRALWALGHTVEFSADPDLRWWANQWFDRAAGALARLSSPRAIAFNMLGACGVLRASGRHAQAEAIAANGGDVLHRLLQTARRPDWIWFESVLGYDNPRLSQALIEAGDILNRADWTNSGLETLEWLVARQTASDGMFRPVGSESFGKAGSHVPFDQQPLEAQATIEAAEAAHRATGDTKWLAHARAAYAWFFGANDRGAILADVASGRCRDGVTPRGRNENCGAESILAFQLSYYALQRLLGAERLIEAPAIPLLPAVGVEPHHVYAEKGTRGLPIDA